MRRCGKDFAGKCRDQFLFILNKAVNLTFQWDVWNFLTVSWADIFARKPLLHAASWMEPDLSRDKYISAVSVQRVMIFPVFKTATKRNLQTLNLYTIRHNIRKNKLLPSKQVLLLGRSSHSSLSYTVQTTSRVQTDPFTVRTVASFSGLKRPHRVADSSLISGAAVKKEHFHSRKHLNDMVLN